MSLYSHIKTKDPVLAEARKGANIADAICECIDIGEKLETKVILTFNEVDLCIDKESNVMELTTLYFKLLND